MHSQHLAAPPITLGSIDRHGITVHIPYLSTYAGYNHRITDVETEVPGTVDVHASPSATEEGVDG